MPPTIAHSETAGEGRKSVKQHCADRACVAWTGERRRAQADRFGCLNEERRMAVTRAATTRAPDRPGARGCAVGADRYGPVVVQKFGEKLTSSLSVARSVEARPLPTRHASRPRRSRRASGCLRHCGRRYDVRGELVQLAFHCEMGSRPAAGGRARGTLLLHPQPRPAHGVMRRPRGSSRNASG
jgi:hypothetical protein